MPDLDHEPTGPGPRESMRDATRRQRDLDRAELTNLVFRFTQAVDRRDFDGMTRCCGTRFRARAEGFGTVLVDVDTLSAFVDGLRAAAAANPQARAQHRYFCPAVEVEGEEAEIRLGGEVYNASSDGLRVSGLCTSYRATRESEGWRLCALDVEYLWRQELGEAR